MARILPMLVVDDIAQSMDYYEKTLGFKKTMSMPGEGARSCTARCRSPTTSP